VLPDKNTFAEINAIPAPVMQEQESSTSHTSVFCSSSTPYLKDINIV
jgi:hypothetical protein